jgi:hypothetical protein
MLLAVFSVKSLLSFCNCIGGHFCNNKNQAMLQQKNKVILILAPIKLQKDRNNLTEITAHGIHNFALSL